ncbi:MAG TPA: ribonuclease Z [Bacteroidales bacterium]|nr:ribonuclease Z [Bacteroidales bacterium]
MEFTIQILGSSSALPTTDRFPSAQVVSYNEHPMLIDCGEGTQIQLRRNHISFLKIEHIFISHLHGDHFYGIFGLLTSMNLLGRKKKLHLYAPAELKKVLNYLWKNTGIDLLYEIQFHAHSGDGLQLIADTKNIQVFSFPLKHSKATWGFRFSEKQQVPNIRKEMIDRYELGFSDIRKIKSGQGIYLSDGSFADYTIFTLPAIAPRTYMYCSDTEYIEDLINITGPADVLYHEATFSSDAQELARATGHSTSIQAAHTAMNLGAKALIIGHFSTRYPSVEFLKTEAQTIFSEVFLAYDGAKFTIDRHSLLLSEIK